MWFCSITTDGNDPICCVITHAPFEKLLSLRKGKGKASIYPFAPYSTHLAIFAGPCQFFSPSFPFFRKKAKSFPLIPASLWGSRVSSQHSVFLSYLNALSVFFFSHFLPARLSSMVRLKSSAVEGDCLAVHGLTHFTVDGSISLRALLRRAHHSRLRAGLLGGELLVIHTWALSKGKWHGIHLSVSCLSLPSFISLSLSLSVCQRDVCHAVSKWKCKLLYLGMNKWNWAWIYMTCLFMKNQTDGRRY